MGDVRVNAFVAFIPLLVAATLLGGVCALVMLLARSTVRRLMLHGVEPDDPLLLRARRTLAVATLVAWACLLLALVFPLATLATNGWTQVLLLGSAVTTMVFVAIRMRPYLTEPGPAPDRRVPAPQRRPRRR
ncbi:hypothetical protein AB0H83_50060 [Dactylosporangium sp. NPDC050688]|uniref:hypothetical protein n=1 Tax=Dactylosporangium sp. NPDC050688 TaxID=3157217 RepID=UPI00340BAA8D